MNLEFYTYDSYVLVSMGSILSKRYTCAFVNLIFPDFCMAYIRSFSFILPNFLSSYLSHICLKNTYNLLIFEFINPEENVFILKSSIFWCIYLYGIDLYPYLSVNIFVISAIYIGFKISFLFYYFCFLFIASRQLFTSDMLVRPVYSYSYWGLKKSTMEL